MNQGNAIMREQQHESGDDIFADLCFRVSEQELLRAKLALQIHHIIAERGLTRDEAARILGATPSQTEALMGCERIDVPIARLVEFLALLGRGVDVAVKPAAGRRSGHMSVVVTPIGA